MTLRSLRRAILASGALGAALIATPGSAAVVIDASQVGADVVFAYSGTLDLTGSPLIAGPGAAPAPLAFSYLQSGDGRFVSPGTAGDTVQKYYFSTAMPVFGDGGPIDGIDAGDALFVSQGQFGVAVGYINLGPISGSLTFLGHTFDSLGLTSGTSFGGTLASGDTITLTVAATADVPLPAAAPMLLGALGLFGLLRRKRG